MILVIYFINMDFSSDYLKQLPGLSQIWRVESFREPAVYLPQNLSRIVHPVLLPPQTRQARRCTQLPGLGALTTSYLDCFVEAGFGFDFISLHELQLPPQAVNLRFPMVLICLLN
jgi:hypothetical protein